MVVVQCAWLPHEKLWAHHGVKWMLNFGIFTTNGIEIENRYLKRGFSMKFTIFDVFLRMIRPMEESDEARRDRIVTESHRRYVPPRDMEVCTNLPSRISQFFRSAVERHPTSHKLV